MKLKKLLGFCLVCAFVCAGHAEMVAEVEGVQVPTALTMEGVKLTLNGAAVRKRAYFKPDVLGLYLPAKVTTLDAAVHMPGPKRVRIFVLRELTGAVISKHFLNDFKQVATEGEFKQMINEIGQIGAIYGAVPRVVKGDVVDIDWVPGKGLVSTLNGKPLQTAPINSEKMYEVTLRIVAGAAASQEMREQLLGQKPTPMVEVAAAK
jgi:hypothetical protein